MTSTHLAHFVEQYQRASDGGEKFAALSDMAVCFRFGPSGLKNRAKSLELLKENKSVTQSLVHLSKIYAICASDSEAPFADATSEDDPEEIHRLGAAYAKEGNRGQALSFYSRAASNGHILSMIDLANLYVRLHCKRRAVSGWKTNVFAGTTTPTITQKRLNGFYAQRAAAT